MAPSIFLDSYSDRRLLKIEDGQAHRGDILFLPSGDSAYAGVEHDLPKGVKGHPVVILEIFPDGIVWFLLISSIGTRTHDPLDSRHISIFDNFSRDRPGGKLLEDSHESCNELCRTYAILADEREMYYLSYINSTHVYELSLQCLERQYGYPKKLRTCSFALMADLAAEAITEALARSTVYGRGKAKGAITARSPLYKLQQGSLCWLQSAEAGVTVLGDTTLIKMSGPCVVYRTSGKSIVICMIRHPESKSNEAITEGFLIATDIVRNSLREIGCYDPQHPHEPKNTHVDPKEIITLDHVTDASTRKCNFLNGHFVLCYPCFEASDDELYHLPLCDDVGQFFVTGQGLKNITRARNKAKKQLREEKRANATGTEQGGQQES